VIKLQSFLLWDRDIDMDTTNDDNSSAAKLGFEPGSGSSVTATDVHKEPAGQRQHLNGVQ